MAIQVVVQLLRKASANLKRSPDTPEDKSINQSPRRFVARCRLVVARYSRSFLYSYFHYALSLPLPRLERVRTQNF